MSRLEFLHSPMHVERIWEKLETSQYLDQSMLVRPRAGHLI
jgi:hypothetical protein